jgi:hypothetical protein
LLTLHIMSNATHTASLVDFTDTITKLQRQHVTEIPTYVQMPLLQASHKRSRNDL